MIILLWVDLEKHLQLRLHTESCHAHAVFSGISFNDECTDEWLPQGLRFTGRLAALSASFSLSCPPTLFLFFALPHPLLDPGPVLSPTLSVSHPRSLSHSVPLAASGCLSAVPLPMCQGAHWADNTYLMYVRGRGVYARGGACQSRTLLAHVRLRVCVCVCYMLQMPVLSLFMCPLTQTSSASFAVRATSHYSDCWGRERRAAETAHTRTQTHTHARAQTSTHSFSVSLSLLLTHTHSTHTVHTHTHTHKPMGGCDH